MQVYRHIPVDVEAVKVTRENAEELAAWCGGRVVEEIDPWDDNKREPCIQFHTSDGVKRARLGQMLVKTKGGTFLIHNAGFFETMFNPLEEQDMHDSEPVPTHSHISKGARRI